MAELVCYCHELTREDIKNDLIANKGRSTILERIAESRKNGLCECDDKHPQKR